MNCNRLAAVAYLTQFSDWSIPMEPTVGLAQEQRENSPLGRLQAYLAGFNLGAGRRLSLTRR